MFRQKVLRFQLAAGMFLKISKVTCPWRENSVTKPDGHTDAKAGHTLAKI